MKQSPAPRWHKQISAGIFGTAAIAMAVGGIATPAVSHAEKVWDIGSFDRCVKSAEDRYITGATDNATYADEIKFCCIRSGGEWTAAQGCTAPAATAQAWPTTLPGGVATRPGQAKLP